MSSSYPFTTVPNQISQGGHGAANLAVLVAMLSHGDSIVSAATLAKEVGCSERAVEKAIQYWVKNGKSAGIEFIHTGI